MGRCPCRQPLQSTHTFRWVGFVHNTLTTLHRTNRADTCISNERYILEVSRERPANRPPTSGCCSGPGVCAPTVCHVVVCPTVCHVIVCPAVCHVVVYPAVVCHVVVCPAVICHVVCAVDIPGRLPHHGPVPSNEGHLRRRGSKKEPRKMAGQHPRHNDYQGY